MQQDDSYERWTAAQKAAADAESRLNAAMADFLQHKGPWPNPKEFIEVRFLRNTALELLEHAVAAVGNAEAPRAVECPRQPPASSRLQ